MEKLQILSQKKQNSQNATASELTMTKLIELNEKYRDKTVEMVEVLKTKYKDLKVTLISKDDKLEGQKTELRQILKSEIRKDSGDS